MIKRKDKVYATLKKLTEAIDFFKENDLKDLGIDTNHIASSAKLSRANTSKELNALLKEGKVIKIKGKPVLYLDAVVLKSKFKCNFNSIFLNENEFADSIKSNIKTLSSDDKLTPSHNSDDNDDVFNTIVGSNESLKAQINIAKAAILYPPYGIHTLIIGPTGVGKSTFAEAMYRYAVSKGRIADNAPFITFNCADYSDNPHLLISQLFGYVKGAFTGADKDKSGLIDSANGGILFLDEVHRLPPEGQEMLFFLMDKGVYRRLGETSNSRHAKMLIVAATTEEPKVSMLRTFLRRIPAVIELPSLEKRTIKERVELICRFFREESSRIKVPIKLSKEVLRAFMFYDCPGNIGQLIGDIKLSCANGFLDYMSLKTDYVEIKLSNLSQSVEEGLFRTRDKREYIQDSKLLINKDIIFDGSRHNMESFLIEPAGKIKYESNYYDYIIDNWHKYSQKGLSEKEIRCRVEEDLGKYIQNVLTEDKYKQSTMKNENLLKLVGPDILEAVRSSLEGIDDILGESINEKVLCGLALHIKNLVQRIQTGDIIVNHYNKNISKEHPREFNLAQKIRNTIEDKLNVNIPDGEVAFIAMLLYAIETTKYRQNVGILVIAHGKSTASSMVSVANTLLDVDCIKGIDMPLDEKISTILDKATEEVKKLDKGKGVLILVDMGSLNDFSRIITERTGIKTACADMVSTAMVIEAARKAIMMDIDIETLYKEVSNVTSVSEGKNENIPPISTEDSFKLNLVNALSNTLTFLNPKKTFDTLYIALKSIIGDYKIQMENGILVKFIFHCSCMIERVIKGETWEYINLELVKNSRQEEFLKLKEHFENLEDIFGISIPDTELAYVIEIIDTHIDTH